MYKCHSKNLGHAPRDGELWVEIGREILTINGETYSISRAKKIKTKWNDIPCGHITSSTDPNCTGCEFRSEE